MMLSYQKLTVLCSTFLILSCGSGGGGGGVSNFNGGLLPQKVQESERTEVFGNDKYDILYKTKTESYGNETLETNFKVGMKNSGRVELQLDNEVLASDFTSEVTNTTSNSISFNVQESGSLYNNLNAKGEVFCSAQSIIENNNDKVKVICEDHNGNWVLDNLNKKIQSRSQSKTNKLSTCNTVKEETFTEKAYRLKVRLKNETTLRPAIMAEVTSKYSYGCDGGDFNMYTITKVIIIEKTLNTVYFGYTKPGTVLNSISVDITGISNGTAKSSFEAYDASELK